MWILNFEHNDRDFSYSGSSMQDLCANLRAPGFCLYDFRNPKLFVGDRNTPASKSDWDQFLVAYR